MAIVTPPNFLASIDRINAALENALAQPPPGTGTLHTEEIHIIEFADAPHEQYVFYLTLNSFTERHILRWIQGYMAAKNSQGRRWCPDLSYGPKQTTLESLLPHPIFDDFRTIKVEIGCSQASGMAPGQLDHKEMSIWAEMAGVEYVLCVKFDGEFENAEYKLYDTQANPLVELDPIPNVAPRIMVQFDSGPRYPARKRAPDSFPTNSVDWFVPPTAKRKRLNVQVICKLPSSHRLPDMVVCHTCRS